LPSLQSVAGVVKIADAEKSTVTAPYAAALLRMTSFYGLT